MTMLSDRILPPGPSIAGFTVFALGRKGSWTIRVKTSHWFPILVDIQIPAATPATRLDDRGCTKTQRTHKSSFEN